nr:hypothetical protein [Dyella sp. ASV24]
MADASRYEFNWEEIAAALVRQQGINDGLWTISVNFQFTGKNINVEGKPMRPGFVGSLSNVSLMRVTQAVPGLTVDAARVNPRLTPSTESRRRTN